MSLQIIIDSGADYLPEEAQAANITVVPLKTRIDGVEYLDGITITHREFYEKLETCKELPQTSQVNPFEFEDTFRVAQQTTDKLLVITLSSKLSGTYQSAKIAADNVGGNIFLVDSENVAVGMRVLVDYAVALRDLGWNAAAIAAELETAKKRVCLLALVDTLEYLYKGGRLSRVAALAGGLLNIKPVIGIKDGVAVILGKARGSRQSNNLLNETVAKKGGIDFTMPVHLAYSGNDDALLRGYIENSRAIWEGHTDSLPVSVIGSSIGTHAGPGAIAVAFFAKQSV
ncbi:MAG: DegV family protein [Clostridia bacterium]|nr:DegV family protein [Clostridia bacterium]